MSWTADDWKEGFRQLEYDIITYENYVKYASQNRNHNTFNQTKCNKMREAVASNQAINLATTLPHVKNLMSFIDNGVKKCDYLKCCQFIAIKKSFCEAAIHPIFEIVNLYGVKNINQIKGVPSSIYKPPKRRSPKNDKPKPKLIEIPPVPFAFIMKYIYNCCKAYNISGSNYYKLSS